MPIIAGFALGRGEQKTVISRSQVQIPSVAPIKNQAPMRFLSRWVLFLLRKNRGFVYLFVSLSANIVKNWCESMGRKTRARPSRALVI